MLLLQAFRHRNMSFTLEHAKEMPEPAVTNLVAEDLGRGILRVRAEVANVRLIPRASTMAGKTRCGLPDFLAPSVSGGVVVAGGLLEGEPLLETVRPQRHRPARLRVESGVASHGRIRAEWIVEVDDPEGFTIEVVYRAEKGGTVSRTPGI